jgi:hypothetical protein
MRRPFGVLQQLTNQGGFACPEKAGDDSDWNFVHSPTEICCLST